MHNDVHAPNRSSVRSDGGYADAVLTLPAPGRRWHAIFLVVAVVHLVSQVVFAGGPPVAKVTQWLLVPILWVLLRVSTTAPRPPLVRLVLFALVFSWLGDAVPGFVPDSVSFLVLMALFLVAQVAAALAFWPYRHESVLVRRRGVVAAYAVVYLVIVGGAAAALLPGGGNTLLVVGLVIYGAALVTMAVLATGVDRLAAIGGALFVVSDGLLGIDQAVPEVARALPDGVYSVAVMGTYAAAQLLLVLGVFRRARLSA